MFNTAWDILSTGDDLGNGSTIRFRLPSGREIFGFGTESIVKGEWALGATWCYLVRTEVPFLLDCGWQQRGCDSLIRMLDKVGFSAADIRTVFISHGHEDHDGGVAGFAFASGAEVKAHPVYPLLSGFYPDKAPPGGRGNFIASCWNCQMPSGFAEKHCPPYHRERAGLEVSTIGHFDVPVFEDVTVHHLPGHSPDAIAVMVGEEAILVGDILLPEITPHPSRESFYLKTGCILESLYGRADQIYGLRAYIRSLKKLRDIGARLPDILVLPGHRVHFHGRWNGLSLRERAEELIEHHVQRCADFLKILETGPKTAREIALTYFAPRLLQGPGIFMAINEVLSHCELLGTGGDVTVEGDRIASTGTSKLDP